MKKLLAIVLSVAMIACFAVVASADDANKVAITISTVDVTDEMVGQEVAVDVNISDVEFGYATIEFTIDWDKDALELVTWSEDFDAMKGLGVGNDNKYAYANASKNGKGGQIAQIIFKVLKAQDAQVTGTVDACKVFTSADRADKNTADPETSVVAGGIKKGTTPPPVEDSSVIIDPPVVESPVDESPIVDPESPAVDESKAAPADNTTVVTPDTTKNTTNNPKSGDASAVAVAGVLCAAMAAAFVITKKSK